MTRMFGVLVFTPLLGGCWIVLGIHDVPSPDASIPDASMLDGITEASDVDAPLDTSPCDAASATDPNNCGACGHSCGGGNCAGGVCQPFKVYQGQTLEPTLASDGATVFFRKGLEVQTCAVTGCTTPAHLATVTSNAPPKLVAASKTFAYWNDGSTVLACNKSSCSTPGPALDLSGLSLTGLASSVASSYVFATGWASSTLKVYRANLDGTGSTLVINESVTPSTTSGGVTMPPKSTRAFWGQIGVPAVATCADLCTSSPTNTTMSLPASPTALAASNTGVYFGTPSGLYSAPSNLSTFTLFAGSGNVTGVAIPTASTATVFYVEQSTGIHSCPLAVTSCPSPKDVELTGASITTLTSDDTAIYWIENDAIMRLVL